jgi:RNA polymerase-interacting CarD/CdnL/TRCF family regulator
MTGTIRKMPEEERLDWKEREEVKSEMLKDGSTNGLRVLQRLIREDGR